MNESPFVTTQRLISESTNAFDELRIIAQDGSRRLSPTDRQVLVRAADELETVQRQLIATQEALIESQALRIALNERLLELHRPVPGKCIPQPIGYRSGWIPVTGYVLP